MQCEQVYEMVVVDVRVNGIVREMTTSSTWNGKDADNSYGPSGPLLSQR
jgi:hypothetical protein